MASNMGAQKARAMKSGSGAFDVDDFVSKLLQFMGGQKSLEDSLPDDSDGEDLEDNLSPLNWERIGRKAMAKSRRAPALNFMCVFCRTRYYVSSHVGPGLGRYLSSKRREHR